MLKKLSLVEWYIKCSLCEMNKIKVIFNNIKKVWCLISVKLRYYDFYAKNETHIALVAFYSLQHYLTTK